MLRGDLYAFSGLNIPPVFLSKIPILRGGHGQFGSEGQYPCNCGHFFMNGSLLHQIREAGDKKARCTKIMTFVLLVCFSC